MDAFMPEATSQEAETYTHQCPGFPVCPMKPGGSGKKEIHRHAELFLQQVSKKTGGRNSNINIKEASGQDWKTFPVWATYNKQCMLKKIPSVYNVDNVLMSVVHIFL